MLDELRVYDDLEPKGADLNMAVDEALLIDATAPLLRFYRWRHPSLSFGYFGQYSEVEEQTGERDIVRRWTGGGVVPHGEDLTYSVIVPRAHPAFLRSSLEVYGAVHEAIRRALEANKISATLAEQAAPKISGNCFANAVRADVLLGDRKIAGAAHRRSRFGLLHQGSIQATNLPERFREDFSRGLCANFERRAIEPASLERAKEIASEKYGTEAWLRRR
jgi:lipoate-protein ligase A